MRPYSRGIDSATLVAISTTTDSPAMQHCLVIKVDVNRRKKHGHRCCLGFNWQQREGEGAGEVEGKRSLPFSIRAGAGSRRAVSASTTLGVSTKSIPITPLVFVCRICMTHAAYKQAEHHKMACMKHAAHHQMCCMIQGCHENSHVQAGAKDLGLTYRCGLQYTCTVISRTSILTSYSDAPMS